MLSAATVTAGGVWIDQRGADLPFQVPAVREDCGGNFISSGCPVRDGGRIFDVDNTLAVAMNVRLIGDGIPPMIVSSCGKQVAQHADPFSSQ